MRYRLIVGFAVILTVGTSRADLPISLFVDTSTHVERAKDIVIARCLKASQPVKHPGSRVYPGSHTVLVSDFEVVRVLKGARPKGKLRVAHVGLVTSSRTYLLFNGGGKANGTTFLAFPELEIVEIPSWFKLSDLDGRATNEQVTAIFKARKKQVERELRTLQIENDLLRKAVGEPQLP